MRCKFFDRTSVYQWWEDHKEEADGIAKSVHFLYQYIIVLWFIVHSHDYITVYKHMLKEGRKHKLISNRQLLKSIRICSINILFTVWFLSDARCALWEVPSFAGSLSPFWACGPWMQWYLQRARRKCCCSAWNVKQLAFKVKHHVNPCPGKTEMR